MSNWWKRIFSWRAHEDVETENQPFIDTTERSIEAEPGRSWMPVRTQKQRREQQLTTLQEGFSELVGLTRSIREHMDQQTATQRTLVEMMQHLPDAVEGLKNVGKATEQQTETLGLLKSQLESNIRHDQQMVDSMTSFNRTLALMNETSKGTAQTVGAMADRTKDSEEMLRNILERSERRLVWMVVMLMIGTLTVLGVGLYIGFSTREAHEPVPVMEPAQKFDQGKTIAGLGEEVVVAEPDSEVMTEPPLDTEESPVVEETSVEETPVVLEEDVTTPEADPEEIVDPM
jgi:hypothetical protein